VPQRRSPRDEAIDRDADRQRLEERRVRRRQVTVDQRALRTQIAPTSLPWPGRPGAAVALEPSETRYVGRPWKRSSEERNVGGAGCGWEDCRRHPKGPVCRYLL